MNIRHGSAYAWEVLYERAITESEPPLRSVRLLQAQEAILERARMLETESGQHELEVQALNEAADFIRELKVETQSDGVGKEIEMGEAEPLRGRNGQGRGFRSEQSRRLAALDVSTTRQRCRPG